MCLFVSNDDDDPNTQSDYSVKWADGVESFVSVSAAKQGPMVRLIAQFEAEQAKKRVSRAFFLSLLTFIPICTY